MPFANHTPIATLVDCLTQALPDLLEPNSGIRTVDDASQKSEPLSGIVAVPPNVVLGDLGIQGKKTVHIPRFGEYISRVAELRGFDDDSFLDVENVFVAKHVDPSRPA